MSPSLARGSKGAKAFGPPERIEGCRESEVSREWVNPAIRIGWLWNGFNTLEEPQAGGIQRGRAAGHLDKEGLCTVVPAHTLRSSHKAAQNQYSGSKALHGLLEKVSQHLCRNLVTLLQPERFQMPHLPFFNRMIG